LRELVPVLGVKPLSIEETLVAVALGSALTLGSSILAQDLLLKRQKAENTKERVYSPLYDEVSDGIDQLEQGDCPASSQEWDRISSHEHLTYLVSDRNLQSDLRKYYREILNNLTQAISTCTNYYPALVTEDLVARTGIAATNSEVQQMSQAVGWSLHRGKLREHQVAYHSAGYEKLKSSSPQAKAGLTPNFVDYLAFWKEKTRNDPQIVEYRKSLERALLEGRSLRDRVGRKLGVKTTKGS